MWENFVNWLESELITCHTVKHLGMECPGCGTQRAFIALLRGDLGLSLAFYPALLPLLFTYIFVLLHLIFKFKHGAAIIKYSFILSTGLILANYFYKLSVQHI